MKREGFTLVEIMIVVAILGLIASIALPSFAQARENSQASFCSQNLRILRDAKEQWAFRNSAGQGVVVADLTGLDVFVQGGTNAVVCPADSTRTFAASYSINPVGTNPSCQIQPQDHIL